MGNNINKEINEDIDSIKKLLNIHNENYHNVKLPYPHNRILYGAPGTGKSYTLTQNMEGIGESNYERVTFHPAYTYGQFFGAYKPVGTDSGIEYKYVMGPFLRVLIKALCNPSENFILVIEEINRANVAAVFGDAFQLLDRKNGASEYKIDVSSEAKKEIWKWLKAAGRNDIDSGKIGIPANMYIWATMNSADQGVMPMDTAFKRRWDFEYIGIDDGEEALSEYKYTVNGVEVYWNDIRKAINTALEAIEVNEDKCLGPFFISKETLDNGLEDNDIFIKAFENKVLMYLFEDAAQYNRGDVFSEDYKSFSKLLAAFRENGMDIIKKIG